jgi:hypothetical protein
VIASFPLLGFPQCSLTGAAAFVLLRFDAAAVCVGVLLTTYSPQRPTSSASVVSTIASKTRTNGRPQTGTSASATASCKAYSFGVTASPSFTCASGEANSGFAFALSLASSFAERRLFSCSCSLAASNKTLMGVVIARQKASSCRRVRLAIIQLASGATVSGNS